jgi:hypothetical protein
MTKKNQMTINEYREKHKRCKTCVYASQNNYDWYCLAKGTCYVGNVGDYALKGCFCELYKAKEFKV